MYWQRRLSSETRFDASMRVFFFELCVSDPSYIVPSLRCGVHLTGHEAD
jgi:hypothetical protein